jgi:hypothetical protein
MRSLHVMTVLVACGLVLTGCTAPPAQPNYQDRRSGDGPTAGRWYDAPPLHYRPWPYRRPIPPIE